MKWSEICIHTTEEAVEAVTNILYEAGAGGVVIEDALDLQKDRPSPYGEVYSLNPDDFPAEGVNIKAYLPVNSFLGETVEEIRQSVNNLLLYDIDPGDNSVSISEHNEEEWATAWKKYYKPVTIGSKLTVTPTWIDYRPESPDETVIELDPGMAFGTGTHPTTILCIEALEKYMSAGANVLDIGTGTGILAIGAAKLGAGRVLAVDLDPVAVRSARLNAKLNKVQDRVEVRQNNLAVNLSPGYDIIVGNLLAEIIIRLAEERSVGMLKEGGLLIASGIIKAKAKQVADALSANGFQIADKRTMEDWVCLIARRES